MKEEDKLRLENAAIGGVTLCFDGINPGQRLVKFLEKCPYLDALQNSNKVRGLTSDYLIQTFHEMHHGDDYSRKIDEAFRVVELVKLPRKDLLDAIMCFLNQFAKRQTIFSSSFHVILERFAVPENFLDGMEAKDLVEKCVDNKCFHVAEILFHLAAFSKYATLSPALKQKIVEMAVLNLGYKINQERELEIIVSRSGYNEDEIMVFVKSALMTMANSGSCEQFDFLVNRYNVSNEFVTSKEIRDSAAKGALRMYISNLSWANKMVAKFEVGEDNFDKQEVQEVISRVLLYRTGDDSLEIILTIAKATGQIQDEVRETLRNNLGNFVYQDHERLRTVTRALGISWHDVMIAVEQRLIEDLSKNGSSGVSLLITNYGLSAEFLESEPVKKAAMEGLVHLLSTSDTNNTIPWLQKTFGV